jgi:hypothetical protein
MANVCAIGSSRRKPTVGDESFLHVRFRYDCGQRSIDCTTVDGRPPLLCTCVCAPQKSLFRRQTSVHRHRSGGRQPPVGNESFLHVRLRYNCGQRSIDCTTVDGRPPLLLTCVGVSQIAHFAPNARRAARAAGVSQPWYGKRMCGAKRNQSTKAVAVASANSNHGGRTPRRS